MSSEIAYRKWKARNCHICQLNNMSNCPYLLEHVDPKIECDKIEYDDYEILNRLNILFSKGLTDQDEDTNDPSKWYYKMEYIVGGENYENLEEIMFKWLVPNGEWDLDHKKFLKDNGYTCRIGDGDSFGILVACICKDNKFFSIG